MAGVHGMMMMGRPPEVVFINTVNHTQANIHTLMGSPTVANVYIFKNTATISAASTSGWALQTGTFPAGSTLKIINRGHIRGGGGNGGDKAGGNDGGKAGGTALILNFPAVIDNTSGTIWGGGGGGGNNGFTIGGRGAGIPVGAGAGTATATTGGSAGSAGRGGDAGEAGGNGNTSGGRGGYSVETNGNASTWIAEGDRRGVVV